MAVNNNNIQSTDNEYITILKIPESLLNKITPGQKKLIETLAANPQGLFSSELTRQIAISNKSHLVDSKLKTFLEKENLEIFTRRIGHEWLWGINSKSISLVGRS